MESLYIRNDMREGDSRKFEGRVRVVDGIDGIGAVAGVRFSWTIGGQGAHVWEDQG